MADHVINTERLCLRHWAEKHREPFVRLHADPRVMADMGGPLNSTDADAKFDGYRQTYDTHGHGRWAVEDLEGRFLGYTGVMARDSGPLGFHREIGWRFLPEAWGHGYATEAAHAALQDAFIRLGLLEILAYTAPDNLRSQAVIRRLGMERDAARDFVEDHREGRWHGLVWVARPS